MNMPFGKWKGRDLSALPKDYIEWALGNMDKLRPELRGKLTDELARREQGGEEMDQRGGPGTESGEEERPSQRPAGGTDGASVRRMVREEMATVFEGMGAALRKRLDG